MKWHCLNCIVITGNCTKVKVFREIISHCSKDYDDDLLDQQNYNLSWTDPISSVLPSNQSFNGIEESFIHKLSDDQMMFQGRLHFYPRDGYIAKLGSTLNESVYIMKLLQDHDWIDQYTRVIFVEFGSLNINRNLFTSVTIALEFLVTGDRFFLFILSENYLLLLFIEGVVIGCCHVVK